MTSGMSCAVAVRGTWHVSLRMSVGRSGVFASSD
jgi:hypothetical protein